MTLDERVARECWGHSLNEVGAVAVGLLMNIIVQKTPNKDEALRYCDLTLTAMCEVMDRNYDQIREELKDIKEQ